MAGWSRSGGDESLDADELHEINVTPFIDVMLVLLIIFMVAAPLATVAVPVDLPATSGNAQSPEDDPLYVTLSETLQLSVENTEITATGLSAALDDLSGGDRDIRVFVRADRAVPYGEVMALMNLIRDAGYTRLALVGMESRAPQPAVSPP